MRASIHNLVRRNWPWALQAALVVLLVATARWSWERIARPAAGEPPAARLLREAASAEATAATAPPAVLDAVTWQRPLRQAAVSRAAPSAKPPEPVNLEVVGVVLDGAQSKAFIRDRSGNVTMAAAGAAVDAWQIVEIKADMVVVRQGDRVEQLRITAPHE